MLKRPFTILTLSGVLIFFLAAINSNGAAAGEGKTFVGSWIVSGTADGGVVPPFTNFSTAHADGTMVNTDPTFGTGHGAWKRIDHGDFSIKFLTLIPDDNLDFPPGTFLTVTGGVTVSIDGDTASGPFVTVFENPGIGVLFSFTGTVDFERISLDD